MQIDPWQAIASDCVKGDQGDFLWAVIRLDRLGVSAEKLMPLGKFILDQMSDRLWCQVCGHDLGSLIGRGCL